MIKSAYDADRSILSTKTREGFSRLRQPLGLEVQVLVGTL
jgi:hypothetical protein